MSRWVLDASPLILLGKTDRLWMLESLTDERIVPTEVWSEIMRGPEGDPAKAFLKSYPESFFRGTEIMLDDRVHISTLGLGERGVLSYCLAKPENSIAVLDDLAARRVAQRLGIRSIGTLGVFLRAKRKGLLRELAPELEALREAGMNLSDALFREVLVLAGEWSSNF